MEAVAGDNMKWTACYAFTVCDGPLSTEVGSEPYRKVDVAKAKQLLAESGYKGEKLVLLGTPLQKGMPTDIFPNIRIPIIAVTFQYAGMPPDEMSGRITAPSGASAANSVSDVPASAPFL